MSETAPYIVRVPGCDANTSIVIDLTPTELDAVKRVADQVTRHGGGCAPTMEIYVPEETDDDYYDLTFNGHAYNLGKQITLADDSINPYPENLVLEIANAVIDPGRATVTGHVSPTDPKDQSVDIVTSYDTEKTHTFATRVTDYDRDNVEEIFDILATAMTISVPSAVRDEYLVAHARKKAIEADENRAQGRSDTNHFHW